MGFWVSGCLRVFMGFQVSIGTYGGHWCRWVDGLFMRVYGGLWVSLSAMRIYKFLWGCLWATIIFYMSDYGYMIVYGCSWVFVSVYECLWILWVFMGIYPCSWVLWVSIGYLWVSGSLSATIIVYMGDYGYLWVSIGVNCCLWVLLSTSWVLRSHNHSPPQGLINTLKFTYTHVHPLFRLSHILIRIRISLGH